MDDKVKLYWDISQLHEWDKNPRNIKKEDFIRLKEQIQRLGQYKPLLITPDGTVLGGNMRLKAFRELGLKDIWVSIVNANSQEQMLEYALSDNDRAGYYDEDMLANLTGEYPDMDWGLYAVDIEEPKNIDALLKDLEKKETEKEEEKVWGVVISAANEAEEDSLLVKLSALGYTMKRLSDVQEEK